MHLIQTMLSGIFLHFASYSAQTDSLLPWNLNTLRQEDFGNCVGVADWWVTWDCLFLVLLGGNSIRQGRNNSFHCWNENYYYFSYIPQIIFLLPITNIPWQIFTCCIWYNMTQITSIHSYAYRSLKNLQHLEGINFFLCVRCIIKFFQVFGEKQPLKPHSIPFSFQWTSWVRDKRTVCNTYWLLLSINEVVHDYHIRNVCMQCSALTTQQWDINTVSNLPHTRKVIAQGNSSSNSSRCHAFIWIHTTSAPNIWSFFRSSQQTMIYAFLSMTFGLQKPKAGLHENLLVILYLNKYSAPCCFN